jgi:hypothetical protein
VKSNAEPSSKAGLAVFSQIVFSTCHPATDAHHDQVAVVDFGKYSPYRHASTIVVTGASNSALILP